MYGNIGLLCLMCTDGSEEVRIQPFSARRRARVVRIQDELDKCSEPLIGDLQLTFGENPQKINSVSS